jgi:hypothetical protein
LLDDDADDLDVDVEDESAEIHNDESDVDGVDPDLADDADHVEDYDAIDSRGGSEFGDDEPVSYDIDIDAPKLGAVWKRRDKSLLPRQEFKGPPLEKEPDSDIE